MVSRFEPDVDALRNLLGALNERLLPERSFREHLLRTLASIKQEGLSTFIEVSQPSGPQIAQYGDAADSQPLLQSSSQGQTGVVETRVSWWVVDRTTDIPWRAAAERLTEELFQIIKAHWGDRDQLSLLPRATSGLNHSRFERALATQCRDVGTATGAFLDLDEFKKVNSDYSYDIGNDVIREFAQRLRRDFGEDSVIIHQGGDEFTLVVPDAQPSQAIYRLNSFRRRVANEAFEKVERAITCTIAVTGYPGLGVNDIGAEGWVAAFMAAFRSVTAAKPGRNMLLFPSADPTPDHAPLRRSDLVKTALLARADVVGPWAWPYSFDAAAVRALEDDLANCTIGSLQQTIAEHTRSMNLSVGVTLRSGETAVNKGWSPAVRRTAIIVASCLRSVYKGGQCLPRDSQVYLSPSPPNRVLELVIRNEANDTVATLPILVDVEFDVDVETVLAGKVWVRDRLPDTGGIVRPADEFGMLTSPYAVIEVGDDRVDAAIAAASATVIRVDSRPVTGGGLPDFWQSNVARVIAAAIEHCGFRKF